MAVVKRERWTEQDVLALPDGEHDYFERKSGTLFDKSDELQGKLAKTLSALANSGGGHMVLGVADDGTLDGTPPTYGKGRQLTRDWLEQKIPYLMTYPLADLRVHVVEPATPSQIPAGREVIVIDVGDSQLAPHQCAYGGGEAQKYAYYYRQGGRSEHAPHFYLELLRQRLVNPALELRPLSFRHARFGHVEQYGAHLLIGRLDFLIQNTSRVAAYKWRIVLAEVSGYPEGRYDDYSLPSHEYQYWTRDQVGGVRLDDTILPGTDLQVPYFLTVKLRNLDIRSHSYYAEADRMLLNVTFGFRVATETSPGEIQPVSLRSIVDADDLKNKLLNMRDNRLML